MRSEQKQIEGNLVLTDELQLYGQVTGVLTVERGGVLHLYGMVGKGLVVRSGGKATVHGMVNGGIRNEGDLHVHGMVLGGITTIPPGQTTVAQAASVSGGVA